MEETQKVLKKFIIDKIGLFWGDWHVIDDFSTEELRKFKTLAEECLFDLRQKENYENEN